MVIVFQCYSCKESKEDYMTRMVNDWRDKTIIFPQEASFMSYVKLMKEYKIYNSKYTVVTYVDSIGCISCKFQLSKWKELIQTLDSVSNGNISFLFFFHPKHKKDLIDLMKRNSFTYPVCIDENDSFNKLNQFPSDMTFQTFLINKDNKVIAMGNPVYNPKIRELYLNIITGNDVPLKSNICRTKIQMFEKCIDLGSFDWNKEQRREIKIQNIGDVPLVIDNVVISCGCTHVEYDKKPVLPHKDVTLVIVYKTEHPEHFSKTITIYSNAESSPIQLKITGNAK